MQEKTTRWGMPFIIQNQAHKEVTVNQSIAKLDAILAGNIISRQWCDVNEQEGALYIASANTIVAWQKILPNAAINDLLFCQGGWQIIKPRTGMLFWLAEEDALLVFSNDIWHVLGKLDPIDEDDDDAE